MKLNLLDYGVDFIWLWSQLLQKPIIFNFSVTVLKCVLDTFAHVKHVRELLLMKKIKIFSFIVMALLGCGTASAQQSNASAIQRPKLVVGIVVDQMRWDYLYRYQKRYTDGGFKRLLGEDSHARTP